MFVSRAPQLVLRTTSRIVTPSVTEGLYAPPSAQPHPPPPFADRSH